MSRRTVSLLRNELALKIRSDPKSIRHGTLYKVTLPLMSAHKCHIIDPQEYWENRLRIKVARRAAVLIKQGLCLKSVLKDMLISYIKNELFAEHDVPKVRNFLLIYIQLYFLITF